jgi:predicted Zn-dependent peptidase
MGWFWMFLVGMFLPVHADGQTASVYERLPNGAQVIAFIRPDAQYSVASLWVNCGSGADPKGKEGTAHLLEHLLPLKPFNGTTIQIALERQGALLLPETGRDFMAFHIQAPESVLAQVFPLLIEAVRDLGSDPKVLEREKRLMWLETLALYEDPLWLMKAMLEAKLFDGTAYAHPPTGWLETIERLNFEDALRFHRKHFSAHNFALIAVVRNEATLNALKAILAGNNQTFTASASLELTWEENFAPNLEPALKRALSRHNEVFWGIGWRIPISAQEKVAMDALVSHLRQTALPFLFGQLGVVQEWSMVANPVRGEMALTINARLRPYTDLIEKWVGRVLREIGEKGVPDAELARLKRSLAWEHYRNLNNPMRLVRELGWAWAIYGDPRIVERYGEEIANLSSEKIRQIAQRLNSTQPVVSVVRK